MISIYVFPLERFLMTGFMRKAAILTQRWFWSPNWYATVNRVLLKMSLTWVTYNFSTNIYHHRNFYHRSLYRKEDYVKNQTFKITTSTFMENVAKLKISHSLFCNNNNINVSVKVNVGYLNDMELQYEFCPSQRPQDMYSSLHSKTKTCQQSYLENY